MKLLSKEQLKELNLEELQAYVREMETEAKVRLAPALYVIGAYVYAQKTKEIIMKYKDYRVITGYLEGDETPSLKINIGEGEVLYLEGDGYNWGGGARKGLITIRKPLLVEPILIQLERLAKHLKLKSLGIV